MRRLRRREELLEANERDSGGWLLLRDAVDCAHAPDEWFAVDRDDAVIGEELL